MSIRPSADAEHQLTVHLDRERGPSIMLFEFPLFPALFEIPDDWWEEASMRGFTRRSSAYRSTDAEAIFIPLRSIEPPFRCLEVCRDFRGFDRQRLTDVLRGIAKDSPMPPVSVLLLPSLPDISTPPFAYRVLNGVHRYYASIAAGFDQLPVVTRECFL